MPLGRPFIYGRALALMGISLAQYAFHSLPDFVSQRVACLDAQESRLGCKHNAVVVILLLSLSISIARLLPLLTTDRMVLVRR